MKYLKKFESQRGKDQYWECSSEAIYIISKILKMMKVDFDGRYNVDKNLDGILDEEGIFDFEFTINGFSYTIVVNAREIDEDTNKYDGCNLDVHLYFNDKDDEEPTEMDNGRILLDELIRIKGNPWIKKMNGIFESTSKKQYEWENTTEALNVVSKVLDVMKIKYKKVAIPNEEQNGYEPDGIVDFRLNGRIEFKINELVLDVVIHARRLKFSHDGSDIEVMLLYRNGVSDDGYKDFVIKDGAELYHRLTALTGESFKWIQKINGINEGVDKNDDKNRGKLIILINKILNHLRILMEKTEWYLDSISGDTFNDGDSNDENFQEVEFYRKHNINTEFAIDHIDIDIRKFKFDGFYNEDGDISLYGNGDLHDLEEITTKSLWDIITLLNGVPEVSSFLNRNTFKQINESNNFEWSCVSEAVAIIKKVFDKMNIDYKWYYDWDNENGYLDGSLNYQKIANVNFEIDICEYYIVIFANWDEKLGTYRGDDIRLEFYSANPYNPHIGEKIIPIKDGKDLYHNITRVNGMAAKWMKKINGVQEIKESINMKHIKSYGIFEKKNSFVNTKSFDLGKWYTKLNKQFFGGKLKKVPLQWNQAKKELGVVKWDEKSGKVEHLAISDRFELTEAETLSVLAHEMIHVWQIQNKKTDGHGTNFKKEMARINDKTKWGIKVMTKQPLGHLKTTNPDLDKDYGFIVIKNNKTDFDIAIFNPDKTDYKNILTIIKQNVKGSKKVDVEVRSTQNGTVKQYKKESTNKTINTYKLDDVTFDTLMSDSKKIYGGKIGK